MFPIKVLINKKEGHAVYRLWDEVLQLYITGDITSQEELAFQLLRAQIHYFVFDSLAPDFAEKMIGKGVETDGWPFEDESNLAKASDPASKDPRTEQAWKLAGAAIEGILREQEEAIWASRWIDFQKSQRSVSIDLTETIYKAKSSTIKIMRVFKEIETACMGFIDQTLKDFRSTDIKKRCIDRVNELLSHFTTIALREKSIMLERKEFPEIEI